MLRLFDSSLPVLLSVDASPLGVGAVLLQNGQPLEFASRTLTETEQRYAQIEKELLAVFLGVAAVSSICLWTNSDSGDRSQDSAGHSE